MPLTGRPLVIHVLPGRYAICRLRATDRVPAGLFSDPFYSVTRTPEELSIVCLEASAPAGVQSERDRRLLAVEGPLDFSLTGILADLAGTLATAGVSIFSLSTYDTDYLLVRDRDLPAAAQALRAAGHTIRHDHAAQTSA